MRNEWVGSPAARARAPMGLGGLKGMPASEALMQALHRALGWQDPGEEALEALASLGQTRTLKADETLLSMQQPATELWLLVSGTLCMGHHDHKGQWQQSRMLSAGQWVDLTSAWLGGSYLEEAVAAEASTVHGFSLGDLQALGRLRPALWSALMPAMVAALAAQNRRLVQLGQRRSVPDASSRAAAWLLEQHHEQGGQIQLKQRKKYIASQWGVAPETFSRIMRQLQHSGLISMRGYRVQVQDQQGLERLAEHGPL
ncbi:Crp/Fnr family transcriptional regulator [Pelomonas sp. CA6]|uniref:Crp/Fnr family transcriptional regulator n=1 Tax=Pelomonas sp. CA6 TaxID=2907999 RepID=UPI001F4C252B|nr:Crp/Fnr family transcriptional regulator [Pelomonas sp. CA6]MCH7344841.1 Crp/Fnr family transcriptional regulator [Pelomonas sp. CA6]